MNFRKILKSGIFKLDDKGKPIGIFKLRRTPETPQAGPKDLSKHCHSLNKTEINGLIRDLSFEMDNMISKPDTNPLIENVFSIYELQLKSTLFKTLQFTEVELNPQLKQLIQKMRKVYIKKLKRGDYPGLTGPRSQAFESAMWVDILMSIFRKYIDIKDVDALTYLSHVLKASGIEKGNIKAVFNRIRKRRHDHRKSVEETKEKLKKGITAISDLENNS
ncbi:MAG: hypothetical protein OET07_14890 [Desulfobacteraceae bacterium]|nr:hypothetical protein [Desulfobacteraceae bacterium]MDH3719976.1 hypothetical protein [Desulfobacteraceae bacterium]MDH3835521.1 hypothetical protein [Desulfobacteraceae bacterium]MDH3875427.1 hypothetical protein [Desulfobacteraceae bacterium]